MTITTAPLAFGTELRRLCQERGMSQRTLADLTFFEHSTISRLQSGSRKPSLEAVRLICEALQLSRPEEFRLHFAAGFVPAWTVGMTLDELVDVLQEAV